jgi:hypothetical protein
VAAAICRIWLEVSKVQFTVIVEICNPSRSKCAHQGIPFLNPSKTTDLRPQEVLCIFFPGYIDPGMRSLFLQWIWLIRLQLSSRAPYVQKHLRA